MSSFIDIQIFTQDYPKTVHKLRPAILNLDKVLMMTKPEVRADYDVKVSDLYVETKFFVIPESVYNDIRDCMIRCNLNSGVIHEG